MTDAEPIIENQIVDLVRLARKEGTVKERLFVNCDLHGPAVIQSTGRVHLQGCKVHGDLDEVLVEAEGLLAGAVTMAAVVMERCRLHRVTIAGRPADIAALREVLSA